MSEQAEAAGPLVWRLVPSWQRLGSFSWGEKAAVSTLQGGRHFSFPWQSPGLCPSLLQRWEAIGVTGSVCVAVSQQPSGAAAGEAYLELGTEEKMCYCKSHHRFAPVITVLQWPLQAQSEVVSHHSCAGKYLM